MAPNSLIERVVIERLAADLVDPEPGRIWFNTPEGAFKLTTTDTHGGVAIHTIK